jgi:two-component system chemotaxis response regulator CheB
MLESGPDRAVSRFDLIVVAASAGGLRAISELLASLTADFPAALVIVQHLDPHHRSLLAPILSRRTPLQVVQAEEGQPLRPGCAFVAPPDQHVLVKSDMTLSLTHTGLVQYVRPSANLLFESAAAVCGARALAVVMTGTGSDGSRGARAIKDAGGTVIVEEPSSAEFSGMPMATVRTGCVDLVLPLNQIGSAIQRLVGQGVLP